MRTSLSIISAIVVGGVVLAGCTWGAAAPNTPFNSPETIPEASATNTPLVRDANGMLPAGSETLPGSATAASTAAALAKTFTLAQVAQHGTKDDCWMVVKGTVYDVSAFIKSGKHPGGDAILLGCGKDATQYYTTRGGKGDHPSKAYDLLAGFEIGTLAQ